MQGGVTGDDIAMVATNHGHTALAKLLTKELKLIEKAVRFLCTCH